MNHALPILLLGTVFSAAPATEKAASFDLEPENTAEPGVIGMSAWLDAPAGRHGFVVMVGDRVIFENGTPVKFCGTNHGEKNVAPECAERERRADGYAWMGINAVRSQKFTWQGARARLLAYQKIVRGETLVLKCAPISVGYTPPDALHQPR